MTAATSYIRQTTGAKVSHSAAVRLMANESEDRQAQYGRSRPAPQQKHTRFEVTLSDFGILGLDHQEHEPTASAIDANLTPLLRTAAHLWPKIWRASFAVAIVIGAVALSGCGGGTKEDRHQELTPALVGQSLPGIPTRPYAYDNDTASAVIVNAPGTACPNVIATGAACVLLSTPGDTDAERMRRYAAARQPGAFMCDLSQLSPDVWEHEITRCMNFATVARTATSAR